MVPKLSIGIPVYNGGGTLSECLDSIVRAEQVVDCKVPVLISNNASLDDTIEICSKYSRDYSYIKVVSNKENIGADRNIDAIIHRCESEYIWIFSANEKIINVEALNIVLSYLDEHDVNFLFLNQDNELIIDDKRDFYDNGDDFFCAIKFSSGLISSCVVKKDIWENIPIEKWLDCNWIQCAYQMYALSPQNSGNSYAGVIKDFLYEGIPEDKPGWGQNGAFIYYGLQLVEMFHELKYLGYCERTQRMADEVIYKSYPKNLMIARAQGLSIDDELTQRLYNDFGKYKDFKYRVQLACKVPMWVARFVLISSNLIASGKEKLSKKWSHFKSLVAPLSKIFLFITVEMIDSRKDLLNNLDYINDVAKKLSAKLIVVWDKRYLGDIDKSLFSEYKIKLIVLDYLSYEKNLKLVNRILSFLARYFYNRKRERIYSKVKDCSHIVKIEKDILSQVMDKGKVVFVGTGAYCDDDFYYSYKEFLKPVDMLIIRGDDTIAGIYGIMAHYITGFMLAEKSGNIPVKIDLQHNKNPYVENGGVSCQENGWDKFFVQPYKLNIDKLSTDNISKLSYVEWGLFPIKQEVFDSTKVLQLNLNYIKKLNGLMQRNVQYNDILRRRIQDAIDTVFAKISGQKVLGVKFRSTDYLSEFGWGEFPFQASAELMIEKTKEKMAEWGCEYVYIAVESEESLKAFSKEFEDKLLYYDCMLISNYDGNLPAAEEQARVSGRTQSGIDYIVTEALLAMCDCLLATHNSGAIFAPLIKKGIYENIYYLNKNDF